MKKIHRVIYQEITPPALIALMILTFVVFTREFGRLTETLIRKNADPLTVFQVVLAILPSILIFTVPISFLVGTLIGFSRLSTESEIVAMRSGGIGLYQILWPVLRVSLVVMAATALLTFFLLPAGNWNLRVIRHEIGVRPVTSQIRPRVFNEEIPGKLLYVDDVDLSTRQWEGVFLADQEGEQQRIILAEEGQVLVGEDNRRLQLFFGNGSRYEFSKQDPTKYRITRFGTLDVSIDLPESESIGPQAKRPGDKNMAELFSDLGKEGPENPGYLSLVELNRRAALPVSAIIFAVLGVTLGTTSHRGGRGYGSIVSMIIAFTYYILFATGSRMAGQGAAPIWIGVWGGNILLGLIAVVAIRMTRRGVSILNLLEHFRPGAFLVRKALAGTRSLGQFAEGLRSRLGRWFWRLSSLRLHVARVVDLYVARAFVVNLGLTLLACLSLFYLFTFFELLDDLVASNQTLGLLLEYFLHLLPHVLMLIVPISVLIATLTTFGTLEKTSQVIAFKACGISVYRLSLPIIMVTIFISAGIFILQDYVLPYSNQRQDNLRNLIKGRPVQTSYQPDRNWIFGHGDRLFNYSHYDAKRNLFADLSVYELDISQNRLVRHTYARRATWNPLQRRWTMFDGWSRDLNKDVGAFSTFERQETAIPEEPDYFVQAVKESSKMTYLELQNYIQELQRGGFEVDHLRTELYKKVSFPLVSLVMVILGIPFAFSIGKKGALYGIAAGTLLGIVYWGTFGVFGVLGGNGLLSPLLAAWGPNLVFGSGSVFLFLNVRT